MLPIVIFTTIQETASPSTFQCIIILPLSQSRLPYLIFVVYTSTMTFFLPLTFMIYFYLKIIFRLQYRVPRQHRRSRSSIRTRRKVTILVLSVISVHVLCCSPYWTFQMIATTEWLPQNSSILIPISSLSQFLLFVNSSANPILYAFISEIFRSSFKRVFHCCLRTTEETVTLEKTTAKGTTTALTMKKNLNTNFNRPRTILIDPEIERKINETHKKLSVTINENPIEILNRHNRLLSLAPTTSVFNSETSCVSDF